MSEANRALFNIKMVRECYQMMELMEMQGFLFAREDKKMLLHYAFHQQDLDLVHDAVIHIAAVREKSQGDLEANVTRQYSISGRTGLQEKIEEYIIQLEVASINQEAANRLLERILKERDVNYELDRLLEELHRRVNDKTKENESIRR